MPLPTLVSEDFALDFQNFREALGTPMEQEAQAQIQTSQPFHALQIALPIRQHPSIPIEAPPMPFTTQLPKNAADTTPGTYLFTTFDLFEVEDWVEAFCHCNGWKWEWKCSVAWMVLRLCDEDVADEGEVLVVMEEERLEMRFREEVLVVAENRW